MELNVELDQSYNLKSATDFYQTIFNDDVNINCINATLDGEESTRTDLSHLDVSTAFIRLKNPDYAQDLNPDQALSSFIHEQIKHIDWYNSFDNQTSGDLSSEVPKSQNSNMDSIPVSQINDDTLIEITSPSFDILQDKTVQGK